MIGAAQRYRELLVDLVPRRDLAGGALTATDEARLVTELDRCWNAMTEEEQGHAEPPLDGPAQSSGP